MADKKIYHTRDFDELLEKTKHNIEKYGLQVISIRASDYLPSFSYSIGLLETYQHPELICFGLSTDLMHALINDVAALIKQGEKMESGKNYDNIFANSDAQFVQVDVRNVPDYFKLALKYYGLDQIPAMQLIWTDRENRFPWEMDFEEEFMYKQPLLDRNADFKFREPMNLGIITTRQWLELNQPILRVVHDHDGDWQFLTGDQVLSDGRIVALEELTLKDPTLNELFNLDYGEAADRSHLGSEWTRSKLEESEDEEIEHN
jgi:hypothetical protein